MRKYSIIVLEFKNAEGKIMAARLWKKILFIILVVACLFNIVSKLVKKMPFMDELNASAEYITEQDNKENEKN